MYDESVIKTIVKLMWFNITLTAWVLWLVTIILLSVWLDNPFYQMLSFLTMSLVFYIKFTQLEKKFKEVFV